MAFPSGGAFLWQKPPRSEKKQGPGKPGPWGAYVFTYQQLLAEAVSWRWDPAQTFAFFPKETSEALARSSAKGMN
jgi:hypothetical protein